jgi:hypothetical protein
MHVKVGVQEHIDMAAKVKVDMPVKEHIDMAAKVKVGMAVKVVERLAEEINRGAGAFPALPQEGRLARDPDQESAASVEAVVVIPSRRAVCKSVSVTKFQFSCEKAIRRNKRLRLHTPIVAARVLNKFH